MARAFTRSESDRISLPTDNARSHRTSSSIVLWFRTTSTHTAERLTMYSENNTASANNFFLININDDATAGRVTFRRKANTGNAINLGHSGSYNDGDWHCVVVAWSALNAHYLYIDGSLVASDESTTVTANPTANRIELGCRSEGTTRKHFFDGDISDVAHIGAVLDETDAGNLYDKSNHILNVTGDRGDIASYWPLTETGMPNIWTEAVAWTDPDSSAITDNGTTDTTGPDGNAPAGMTASSDIAGAWIFWNPLDGAVVTESSELIGENGNVVHTPDDTGKEYKYYYTTSPASRTESNVEIGMAYSSDQQSWTDQGVVIANATMPLEDPYVVVDPTDGTYHLWAENKTGGDNSNGIAHFTSSDGFSWTLESGTALDSGSGWESQDVSSPVVWVESGTWYMLYEGRSSGSDGQIGLATASDPAGPWTKEATNPVLENGTASGFDDDIAVPNEIRKIGSTYYLAYRANTSGTWYNLLATSTNLTSWTSAAQNPLQIAPYDGIMFLKGSEFAKGVQMNASTTAVARHQWFGSAAIQTEEWPVPVEEDESETVPRSGVAIMNGIGMV